VNFEHIFDESHERIKDVRVEGRDFFEAFYDRFLGESVEVAEKFARTDMQKQQSMLKKSFYHLLVFYASNHADDYLEKIAHRHSHEDLDVNPQLYDLWLTCLIATLAKFDPQFSDRVELAWRLVMAPGITYMKFHYDHSI
jgi:hemoglobin-like flavoprotein